MTDWQTRAGTTKAIKKELLDTTLDRIHFYIQYHGLNDRHIQDCVAHLYSAYIIDVNTYNPYISAEIFDEYNIQRKVSLQSTTTTENHKISGFIEKHTSKIVQNNNNKQNELTSTNTGVKRFTVGFISKFFGIFEPHGLLLDGVMKHLPRSHFEVSVVCFLVLFLLVTLIVLGLVCFVYCDFGYQFSKLITIFEYYKFVCV
jgi:hypothetical protein